VTPVLEEQRALTVPTAPHTGVAVDERAARRTLRAQVAHLERELAEGFVAAFPRVGLDWSVPAPGGPRLLELGELERLRDDLAQQVARARRALAARAAEEAQRRVLLERMLLEPRRHKWVRVTRAELGEPGCGAWHVRPRLGLIGMLMGWWQVKLSSGCPLARGSRPSATPPRAR